MITLTNIIIYGIIVYIASFIIMIIGHYTEFKGETLQDFKDELTYTRYDDDTSSLLLSVLPCINSLVAVGFLFIGLFKLIKFICLFINKKLFIWDRLKDIKIKTKK